jgi:hypothetical protein
MNLRKATLGALVGGSLLAGVAIGAISFGSGSSSANAATTTGQGNGTRGAIVPGGRGFHAAGSSASPGVFVSNEDPAHEATESAEREAQENAGQRPTVP